MKQNTGPFTQYIPLDQLERNKFGQDDDEQSKAKPGVGITSALLLGNVAIAIKAVFFGADAPTQAANSPAETGEEEPSSTRATPANHNGAEEPPDLEQEPVQDGVLTQKLTHATPALQVLVVGDRMLPVKPLVGSGTAPTLLETPLSNVVSLSNAARPWVQPVPIVEPDAQVGGRGRTGEDIERERLPPVPLNRTPTNMSTVVLGSILLDQAAILYPRELLSQSRDADGDALTITDLRASSGTLQQRVDGSWLYVPEEGRLGDQVFTYRVSDGVTSVEQRGILTISEPTGITLIGTAGADRLNGTLYTDRIDGVGGNDLIFGRSGNDILVGGAGNDTIFGGDGSDLIYGGEGDDVLLGEAGDDVIYGEAGQDFLDGGDGNDVLSGGEGADVVLGAAGNDVLLGGADDDQLDGGSDNDFVDGGEGADSIQGGTGDDTIVGGSGNDTMDGGAGNDHFVASSSTEDAASDGNDAIEGGDGIDTLDLQAITSTTFVNLATGHVSGAEVGNDTIANVENVVGSSAADTIVGDDADNVIEGGQGNDSIDGGDGNDTFIATGTAGTSATAASDGNDTIDGGDGIDTYDANQVSMDMMVDLMMGTATLSNGERDSLSSIENVTAGSGNDEIVADLSVNVMTGGDGNDVFVFGSIAAAGIGSGNRDRIMDLEIGDTIDLSDISRTLDPVQDAFDGEDIRDFVLLRTGEQFTKPGELRLESAELIDDQYVTVLSGNVDDNADTDFEIELVGKYYFDSFRYLA